MKQVFQPTISLSSVWRRALLALALVAATLISCLAVATPARAQVATSGSWTCTVPSGYTYSAIRRDSSCASGIAYFAVLPSNGLWVCKVPASWTYDTLSTSSPYGPCQLGVSRGQSLRLAAPANGRIVCELPKNNLWTYYGVSRDTSTTACRLGNGATGIRLAVPADNLWACKVPTGFTYSQRHLFSGIGTNPCLGSYSFLLKKL